jgi:hypothetical protein
MSCIVGSLKLTEGVMIGDFCNGFSANMLKPLVLGCGIVE